MDARYLTVETEQSVSGNKIFEGIITFTNHTTYFTQIYNGTILSNGNNTFSGNNILSGENTFNATNTFNGPVLAMNTLTLSGGNFYIDQVNYVSGMTNLQLGYTNTSAKTTTTPMTTLLTSRHTFTIPTAGVWMVIVEFDWSTNAANTITKKEMNVSLASGSFPCGIGFKYFEEIDDPSTGAVLRQSGHMAGVFTAGITTTLYVNALSNINSGTNAALSIRASWTKIG